MRRGGYIPANSGFAHVIPQHQTLNTNQPRHATNWPNIYDTPQEMASGKV